ncbi:polymerase [Kovacikia minuta CCNUW1]|uniref:O-antigen ligase family protein n=1 Tax=Kovacikia minuta TaxID=2931930 RepID=UPI001CD0006A|nr:O-antigen ligase family protein [Kovacikia minuta]UBF27325.1 polymerase [Kovacikia minuta CCNUW1]
MLTERRRNPLSHPAFWLAAIGVVIGIAAGLLAGVEPLYLGLLMAVAAVLIFFFISFEQAVIGFLILRSSLDIFSAQQIPAVFAIAVDALTLLYLVVQLFRKQPIQVDKFFWIFATWVVFQGLWVVLLPVGGLGLDASYLPDAIREWARLFSWLMVYLLVMQLRGKVPPERVISLLFLGLILPLTVGALQTFLPQSILPTMLAAKAAADSPFGEASRISGTLGHSNTFATFLLLFISLTCWKVKQEKNRLPWILLLTVILFFYVGTKALFSLMMLSVFVLVLIVPKVSPVKLLGGILLIGVVITLFASTEFGQARLGSIANTPLLNPDIDISRAILLSAGDRNSFNWRIAQWTYLLDQWKEFPIFGFGLGTSIYVSTNKLLPHNDYVRALIEGGIVGLITFLSFLGVQALYLIRLIRSTPIQSSQSDLCLSLLAVLVAIPVGMLTENIWSHTTLFFYWWTIFSVVSWDWGRRSLQRKETMLAEA